MKDQRKSSAKFLRQADIHSKKISKIEGNRKRKIWLQSINNKCRDEKKRRERQNVDVAVKERYNQHSSNLSEIDIQSKKNVQAFEKILKSHLSRL